jgi:hypothetical protein
MYANLIRYQNILFRTISILYLHIYFVPNWVVYCKKSKTYTLCVLKLMNLFFLAYYKFLPNP